MCRTLDDQSQFLRAVEVQAVDHPEAVAQGARKRTRLGGGPDQRKAGQGHPQNLGAFAFADGAIQGEVFHGRVENLFSHFVQAVDLVDKQYAAGLHAHQHSHDVPRALQCWRAGDVDFGIHLGGHDHGQGGLAQAGWTVEEQVINRLAPALGRAEGDGNAVLQGGLPNVIGQRARADGVFQPVVVAGFFALQQAGAGKIAGFRRRIQRRGRLGRLLVFRGAAGAIAGRILDGHLESLPQKTTPVHCRAFPILPPGRRNNRPQAPAAMNCNRSALNAGGG